VIVKLLRSLQPIFAIHDTRDDLPFPRTLLIRRYVRAPRYTPRIRPPPAPSSSPRTPPNNIATMGSFRPPTCSASTCASKPPTTVPTTARAAPARRPITIAMVTFTEPFQSPMAAGSSSQERRTFRTDGFGGGGYPGIRHSSFSKKHIAGPDHHQSEQEHLRRKRKLPATQSLEIPRASFASLRQYERDVENSSSLSNGCRSRPLAPTDSICDDVARIRPSKPAPQARAQRLGR
jgi:hypothetical protein